MLLCSVCLCVKAQTRRVYEQKLIRLMTGVGPVTHEYNDDYDDDEEEEEEDDADEVDLEGEELLVIVVYNLTYSVSQDIYRRQLNQTVVACW